jgi:hypothetical protein
MRFTVGAAVTEVSTKVSSAGASSGAVGSASFVQAPNDSKITAANRFIAIRDTDSAPFWEDVGRYISIPLKAITEKKKKKNLSELVTKRG